MTLPDTDQPLDIRYPVVDAFACPHPDCDHVIGYIIEVNGRRWLRIVNSEGVISDARDYDGRCGRCLGMVHFHG